MSLAGDIHETFVIKGYQWKINGRLTSPTLDDIADTLDRMRETLYAEEEGSQLEVGRLIGKRTKSGIDVYLFMGEENDKDS